MSHSEPRYRVLQRLGSGAAGGVYLVQDTTFGGAPIALKCVQAAADPRFRASFAREFSVLASLSLPGVARVHDLGVTQAGGDLPEGPFFTREYIEGSPFDAFAWDCALERRLTAFAEVVQIVASVHRAGVVHGDLKPANIIVDRDGRAYVIDFGLASRAGDAEALRGSGTPSFMAPELLQGGKPGVGADIYALGASLWTTVTGAPPFSGADGLNQKLRGKLPAVPKELPDLARDALGVALRAMARDRRERTPSASELLAEVQQVAGLAASGEPSSAGRYERPPPRMRGCEGLLDELMACLTAGDKAFPKVCVAHGPEGMGKTALLRELRWRLQLSEAHVVEVRCAEAGLAPFSQLCAEALRHLPGDQTELRELLERLRAGGVERADLVRALELALGCVELRASIVVLIDDLDEAEPSFVEALRSAIHQELPFAPRVLATVSSLSVPVLGILGTKTEHEIAALCESDAKAIVRDVLGSVDAPVEERLVELSEGNPGLLIELLAQLAKREGLAASDLSDLVPGKVWENRGRARVATLSVPARRVFAALAAARGLLPESILEAWVGEGYRAAAAELLAAGLVKRAGTGLSVQDLTAAGWIARQPGEHGGSGAARALLQSAQVADLPVVERTELSLLAGDTQLVTAGALPAAQALAARGASLAAVRLVEAALPYLDGEADVEARLLLAELLAATGQFSRAAQASTALLARGGLSVVDEARARVCAGRAHVGEGQLEQAVKELTALAPAAPEALQAEAARELSRVHLRRGEHVQAMRVVERGLGVASPDSPAVAELIAIQGTLHTMEGDHAAGRACYARAEEHARRYGVLRDRAQVLGYRALALEHEGQLSQARASYEEAIDAARSASDVALTATYALNLGNVSFRTGHWEEAARCFSMAARMARRAGRLTTALLADNNLAHQSVYMGGYARARQLAERSRETARSAGIEIAAAHATHILADIDARAGEVEGALAQYAEAFARYHKLARHREACEVLLDTAEALLDRGGVSDPSHASAKLAEARASIESHQVGDLDPRLRLLLARARSQNGDVEGALRDLEAQEPRLQPRRDRDLRWQLLSAQARMYRTVGSHLLAAAKAREAAELLEATAAGLSRDARGAYLADPRRRAVFLLAQRSESSSSGAQALDVQTSGPDPRFVRLLDILKRLARERQLDRVLERITDAAVDLSGAERGFVLLVDERTNGLMPHMVREGGPGEHDPHVAFSRSIAEAVLIDGEPIVTVNARDDSRVNGFMSVHKLMLKSVACIPINSPVGTVGVLYLEHRMRAGRFDERDLDLLIAFADQAAIALENARLWAVSERARTTLEEKNRELSEANQEIERLLVARTEELVVARKELSRARADLERSASQHGIIGRSAPMQRVFALIDRVQDSNISVVIQGESGTGKELVARAIHYGGCRRDGPFVAINCAALPEPLLESELFGHVRGAFTGADRDRKGLFARADGGTLFLDEFAEMPARMQVDLLRVLQEGKVRPVGAEQELPVDVRVIAASNRPLDELIRNHTLREDLYYRLGVVEIRLPPLRERGDDIDLLCRHFLAQHARQGNAAFRLSPEALRRIVASGLPGNVRQLEHLLLSACTLAETDLIGVGDLPFEDAPDLESPVEPAGESGELAHSPSEEPGEAPQDLRGHKERERARILEALEEHAWNRARAASALGMARRTFYRRLTEFGIL